jgi:hypothetical protein
MDQEKIDSARWFGGDVKSTETCRSPSSMLAERRSRLNDSVAGHEFRFSAGLAARDYLRSKEFRSADALNRFSQIIVRMNSGGQHFFRFVNQHTLRACAVKFVNQIKRTAANLIVNAADILA